MMKLISERVLSWQNRKYSELVFREKEKISGRVTSQIAS